MYRLRVILTDAVVVFALILTNEMEKNNKRWQGRGKIGTPMYCW